MTDMLNIYLLLNTEKLSPSNYNSLLQNLISQKLNTNKRKSSININNSNYEEHRSKLASSIYEEKDYEINQIPVKYKNDIIYPHKIKNECDRSMSKILDNSISKDWDNL
jgi:hypothetical protein